MKHIHLILSILFFQTATVTAHSSETDVQRLSLQTSTGSESILLIHPQNLDTTVPYPILFAPGDERENDPMFFWGDTPGALGWIIVETHLVYRGTSKQLHSLMKAVETYLTQHGISIEGKHVIGWSANSGAASRHVAALGAELQSLSLIPGYAAASTTKAICKHDHLTINFITGSRDSGWLRGAQQMRDNLLACGARSIEFEIIDGGGHVLREISGKPLFDLLNKGRKR